MVDYGVGVGASEAEAVEACSSYGVAFVRPGDGCSGGYHFVAGEVD